MYSSHREEVLADMHGRTIRAAAAMGEAAVAAVRKQMAQGYGHAVRDSGDLMRDVHWAETGQPGVIAVGSSLAYAIPVHNGTSRMAGRPYLTDGVCQAAGQLADAAAKEISCGEGA